MDYQSGSRGTHTPGSWPTRTPRVIAAVPNRSWTASIGGVELAPAVEREHELNGSAVGQVGQCDPDQRQAALLDHRPRRHEQQRGRRRQDRVRLVGRLSHRVRTRGPREILEAHAQHDRPAQASRRPQPTRDALHEADQRRRQLLVRSSSPAERPLGADRAPTAPRLYRPRILVVGERVQMAARCPAEHRHERALPEFGDLADGRDPPRVKLGRGDAADAPQPLDRKQMEEGQLAVRRDRRAGRRAWPDRWRPWPGTSCARSRP